MRFATVPPVSIFQSTLSVRRATHLTVKFRDVDVGFQSTLSVRRATATFIALAFGCIISIHALREESDIQTALSAIG